MKRKLCLTQKREIYKLKKKSQNREINMSRSSVKFHFGYSGLPWYGSPL